MKKVLLVTIIAIQTVCLLAQEFTPAFPTAEGYGMIATGGRGGKVVAVTTLDDNAANPIPGSLRWALKQYPGEPLTVIFKVSGTIDLKLQNLKNKRSNITIAGQTAPGDGICIAGGSVNLGGSRNLIIRHVRFRIGSDPTGSTFLAGASLNIENGGEFILDHCSFSWSAEENLGIYDNENTTVQWSIMSEGLYAAGHGKGNRSYGGVFGGETATFHHNLLAHNYNRAPRFGSTTNNDLKMRLDYVNNVNYNWGKSNACYGGDNRYGERGLFEINIVNNYYRPGPAYPGSNKTYIACPSLSTNTQYVQQGRDQSFWHLSGNYIEGTHSVHVKTNIDNYEGLKLEAFTDKWPDFTLDEIKSDTAFAVPYPVNTETAHEALISVLAGAGAFPRDAVDERIIMETRDTVATRAGTYSSGRTLGIIDNPTQAGGYPDLTTYNITKDTDGDGIPDYWEIANGMNPNDPEDRNLLSAEGYTYLEVYINGIVGEYLPGFVYPTPEYISAVETIPSLNPYSFIDGDKLVIKDVVNLRSAAIYDFSGKMICFYQGNDTEYDVSSLLPGMYILECKTEDNMAFRTKFIR